MRVLIDLRRLGHGGIGRYSELLLLGLQKLRDEEQPDLELSALVRKESLEEARIKFDLKVSQLHLSRISPNSAREYLQLSQEINRIEPDIYHTLNTPLPLGIKAKSVICIQDTIHLKYPRYLFYPLLFSFLIRDAITRADAAYSLSDYTRQEIVKISNKASDKLTVIAPGVPSSWYLNKPKRVRQGLYLLSVLSNNKKHKALTDLLIAYNNLPQSVRGEVKLVIVGKNLKTANKSCDSILFNNPQLEFTDEVSDEELRSLMSHAAALVIPSLMEGFSLPAMEAKLLATRLVARPVGIIPELVGEEDLLTKDFTVTSLVDALVESLSQHKTTSLQHQQLLRRRYDQLLMARRIYSLYRSISGESGFAKTVPFKRDKLAV